MKKSTYLSQFRIPFAGLKLGEHSYTYVIDNKFLKDIPIEDVLGVSANIDLLLTKKETMLIADLVINGKFNLICDRCNDEFQETFDSSQKLVIKFGTETKFEDDIMILSSGEHELDLSHYIYESLTLSVPLKKVHPEGLCNPETISKLHEHEVKQYTEQDPRWEKLKNFKNLN